MPSFPEPLLIFNLSFGFNVSFNRLQLLIDKSATTTEWGHVVMGPVERGWSKTENVLTVIPQSVKTFADMAVRAAMEIAVCCTLFCVTVL